MGLSRSSVVTNSTEFMETTLLPAAQEFPAFQEQLALPETASLSVEQARRLSVPLLSNCLVRDLDRLGPEDCHIGQISAPALSLGGTSNMELASPEGLPPTWVGPSTSLLVHLQAVSDPYMFLASGLAEGCMGLLEYREEVTVRSRPPFNLDCFA